MPDSLIHTTNVADTLIQTGDSLTQTISSQDSLSMIASFRKEGTMLFENIADSNWIFIILLLAFLLYIRGIHKSMNWLTDTFTNFFKIRSRNSLFSKSTLVDLPHRMLLIILTTGVISLFFYLYFFALKPFKPDLYLVFYLVCLAFVFIKSLLMDLTGFIFLDPETYKNAKESYFNLYVISGIVLYPFLLTGIYMNNPVMFNFCVNSGLFIFLLTLFLIIIKIFQIFYHKILDFLYIMLYLCTLEILPVAGLFQALELIIKEFNF